MCPMEDGDDVNVKKAAKEHQQRNPDGSPKPPVKPKKTKTQDEGE